MKCPGFYCEISWHRGIKNPSCFLYLSPKQVVGFMLFPFGSIGAMCSLSLPRTWILMQESMYIGGAEIRRLRNAHRDILREVLLSFPQTD